MACVGPQCRATPTLCASTGKKKANQDKMYPKGLGYIVLFGGIHCECIWETLCYMRVLWRSVVISHR